MDNIKNNLLIEDDFKQIDDYVERIRKIADLSSPLIDDMSISDDYMKRLTENFKDIGRLAKKNREYLKNVLEPIIRSDGALLKKTGDIINDFHNKTFCANDEIVDDLHIDKLITERLLRSARCKSSDREIVIALSRLIESNVVNLNSYLNSKFMAGLWSRIAEEQLELHKIMMCYIDKARFCELDIECRGIVMLDSRYGLVELPRNKYAVTPEILKYVSDNLMLSLSFASDPFYREMLPGYDWDYHIYRIHQYMLYFIDNDIYYEYKDIIADSAKKLKEIIESDDFEDKYNEKDELYFYLDGFDYIIGNISKEEYMNRLYQLYISRDITDDSDEKNRNFSTPNKYIELIDKDNITEEQRTIVEKMYHSMIEYLFNVEKTSRLRYVSECASEIANHFIEIPGGIDVEDAIMRLFAAIHPPTYIHSNMVAKITRCLTHHLLRAYPHLFVGVCGCPDEQHVREYTAKIENFAYHSALCHDLGKIYILDIISTYGRNILDNEFDMIKLHPEMGADLLRSHESTKEYADVAMGHHLWYNGERGYPAAFDAKSSEVKTIIDIVMCADCMDAATDKVGRSYSDGKTLAEYISEVREGSGDHYAPYVADILEQKDVRKDLEYLLDEGRKDIYRKTYLLLKSIREKTK